MTSPFPTPNVPNLGGVPGGVNPQPSTSSTLLGNTQIPSPTPDQRVTGYMDQIRNLHIQIDALANQFPAASEDLDTAKKALASSMAKVAAMISQPEQSPQPQTF